VRALILGEIRASWPNWLGVFVAFVVTNTSFVILNLIKESVELPANAEMMGTESVSMAMLAVFNQFTCALCGLAVIGSAASLVVGSRRGAVARLGLAGATPRQIIVTLLGQLACVSVAASVVANVIASLLLVPALAMVAGDREISGTIVPSSSLWSLVSANLLCLLIALVGGWRQAAQAAKIWPVEALRQAAVASTGRAHVGRWIVVAVLLLSLPGAYAVMVTVAPQGGVDSLSIVMQTALVMVLVTGILLATAAPLTIAAVTRWWTSLVPGRLAVWHLARHTVIAKGERLTKSVVPVMFAMGLVFAMYFIGESLNATFIANGMDIKLGYMTPASLFMVIGLPLCIAVSGGLGSLIMMSRQRDAELALDGIVGATPAQQHAIPMVEALIISVTATLLGIVMGSVAVVFFIGGVASLGAKTAIAVPWLAVGTIFIAATAVTGAATVLPTLASLRRAPQRVVARLIAE
jgi:putative ABC transport system permease protein